MPYVIVKHTDNLADQARIPALSPDLQRLSETGIRERCIHDDHRARAA